MLPDLTAPVVELRGTPDPAAFAVLRQAIDAVTPILKVIAENSGVAMPPVRWLATTDFVADVNEHLQSNGATVFTSDRLGGVVAAKTMIDPTTDGHVIALNCSLLCDPADEGRSAADHMFLVGHELTHVVQAAVRNASGVMVGVPIPSLTARQGWRSITRIISDEYRADRVAAHLVTSLVSVATPDETRPATLLDTFAVNHLASTEDVVRGLHPTLPDLVQSYREWQIPLEDMLHRLGAFTEQTLTALAHWQATCDTLNMSGDFDLGELPVCRSTELYIRPLWSQIVAALARTAVLPSPQELREEEPELVAEGERAIEEWWATLGVTVYDHDDGYGVDVTEPAW